MRRGARRIFLLSLAILLAPFALIAAYALAAIGLGAVPTGSAAQAAPGGVPIYVLSNGYHASFVLPLRAAGIDWAEAFPATDFRRPPPPAATYVMFGWGDRDFYMNTRRLADLRLSTGLTALLSQGEAVMHVTYIVEPATGPDVRPLMLDVAQYRRLAEFINASFRTDAAGRRRLHPGRGYGDHDAFYVGTGVYSLVLTCNEWVGRGLRAAGAPTGLWTPLAQSVLWHL
jgi:uncharacterized protein (TIGR02117 family)